MLESFIDPGGAQNGGVVGAAVLRGSHQSYVVASSAKDGVSGATMTYGVPGATAARHVVYDAPEATDGSSHVSATASGGRCVVAITAGTGGGLTGHPLMFTVGAASGGCAVSDLGSGATAGGGTGGGSGGGGVADAGSNGSADASAPVATNDDAGSGGGDDAGADAGTGGAAPPGCAGQAQPSGTPGTTDASMLGAVGLLFLRRRKPRRR
jgi:hypothetical protein